MDNVNASKKTILVVEDGVSLLNALVDKFISEGFSVLQTKNGEEGLESALKNQPDMILLDIVMPRMDGMTMLKKLRTANEWGKTVPVILLTNLTSADEGRLRDITELEPTYYLVKTDWKLGDVVAKVRERLGTARS